MDRFTSLLQGFSAGGGFTAILFDILNSMVPIPNYVKWSLTALMGLVFAVYCLRTHLLSIQRTNKERDEMLVLANKTQSQIKQMQIKLSRKQTIPLIPVSPPTNHFQTEINLIDVDPFDSIDASDDMDQIEETTSQLIEKLSGSSVSRNNSRSSPTQS
jgi:hypothetical protein